LSNLVDPLSNFSSLTASHTYTLNQVGHRTQVTDFRIAGLAPSATRTVDYTYDALYRLTSETIAADGTFSTLDGTITYGHDNVGNRTSRVTDNPVLRNILPDQAQTYNANDQVDEHSYHRPHLQRRRPPSQKNN